MKNPVLRALLLLCALLKISKADCDVAEPEVVSDLKVTDVTRNSVSLSWTASHGNCSNYRIRWTDGNNSGTADTAGKSETITKLTAGVKYMIAVTTIAEGNHTLAENFSLSQYTKPEEVRILTVTEITTSSIFLRWTEPEGKRSFYRVQWTNGTANRDLRTTETKFNVPELTAGVPYNVSVTAVAGDNSTESEKAEIFLYTKPEAVRNLTISQITTTSMFLNWTEPEGKSSFFRVLLTGGNYSVIKDVTETHMDMIDLTEGVQYEISVTTVAGDGLTEGQRTTVNRYTKPEEVRDLTVTEITTSSIFLRWTEPEGKRSFYRVQWTNGTANRDLRTTETKFNVPELTAGVQYNVSVTAVAGDNSTESEKAEIFHHTKPEAVRNLTISQITTTSMFLNWTEPEGKSSFFRVLLTGGNYSVIKDVTETHMDMIDLTEGVQYEISVTTVAGDGLTEGQRTTVNRYTKPEEVRDLTVTEITTSSIFLRWTEPEGKRSFYRVQWTNGTANRDLRTTETKFNVPELTAGVQYNVSVTAVAGDNSTESEKAEIFHHTKPEAVRNLTISQITTTSMFLNWTEPEGKSSFFRVLLTGGNYSVIKDVTETHMDMIDLTEGVKYEISVTTVAGDGLTEGQRTTVNRYTKPEEVRDLTVTEITTSSIFLRWTEPEGKRSFYRVQWTNGTANRDLRTTETKFNVPELTAGVQYNVSVTAVAGDNSTESEKAEIFHHTKPEAVRNLTISQITTTSMFLNWTEPEGKSSFFRVLLTGGNYSVIKDVTETHMDMIDLTEGVQYEISVTTVAGDGLTEGQRTTVNRYTKPEAVRNLIISQLTTTSMFLNWTEPEGKSSFFRVLLTGGNYSVIKDVTETHMDMIDLTEGVQYEISVTTVAGDGLTEGQRTTVNRYTKPEAVRNLTISQITTTSLFLNWTEPEGKSSFFRVLLTGGNYSVIKDVTETHMDMIDLTEGVQYEISVTAVAGDGLTEGQRTTVNRYTKPEAVRNLTISQITTTSMFLNWTEPEGNRSFYRVEWTNGKSNQYLIENKTYINISELISGENYIVAVISVAGDQETLGDILSLSTKPEAVRNIHVTEITTSSLFLNWTEPEGKSSSYRIQWTDGNYSETANVTQTSVHIPHLTAGVQYEISVTAVAGDGLTEGQSTTVSQYTRPSKPWNIAVTAQGTNYLNIDWTLPYGSYDNYVVNISNEELKYFSSNMTTVAMVNFTDLYPGRVFVITATAVAGTFRNTSDQSLFATLPLPPGSITISQRTTSLLLEWMTPALMEGVPHSYCITCLSADGHVLVKNTTSNNTELVPLSSGTLYNITLETVGPENLRSTAVHTSALTLPEAVTNLTVDDVNTTAIRLMWRRQSDHKPSYSYLVTARQDAMVVQSDSTPAETYAFFGLTPGELYTFDVITLVEGGRSSVTSTSSYTKPAAVLDLAVIGSTTDLSVSWRTAFGQVASYTVLLFSESREERNDKNLSSDTVNKVFLDLKPGVLYCVVVVSQSGPFETNGSNVCNATYPKPPGPIMVESQTVESINFTWPNPDGMDYHHYNFHVFSFKGSSLTENNWFLLDDLQSGRLYNISVVTVGVWNYTSTAVTAGNYTRPYPVTMLRRAEITTNAVTLYWVQQENKPQYLYVVSASNGSIFQSNTVSTTTNTFAGLVAGSNYSFTVTTQTADGTQAAPVSVSYFTKPETVQPSISSQGSNSSVLVSWTEPPGKFEYYEVHLYSGISTLPDHLEITTNTSWLFESLRAGRFYSAMVTTWSGSVHSSSGLISNATFPNPPGPITILSKTTSTINMMWKEASLMTGASFQYRVAITLPQGTEYILGTNTNHTFNSLLSGTSYNLSVATVGVLEFESEEVQIHMVTTRPFSVENLSASVEVESVMMMWAKPNEYKESYCYNVTWQCSDEANSIITKETKYKIDDLIPGRSCNISVMTVTSDGSEGAAREISKCTNAGPVKNLLCEGPNQTYAEVILSWSTPEGHYSAFWITINDRELISNASPCCNHSIPNLLHHTEYKLTVETLSCGLPSTPVSLYCMTGITNPAIPEDHYSMVVVTEKSHNKFSVRIDSRLLDSTNGPITHVGVLVSHELPDDTSNWKNYLGNTYDHWKARNATVYLAKVTENILQSRSAENHLSIVVGDESKWESYTNGALVARGIYHYAIVVFTSLSIRNNFVNGETSMVSRTIFFPPVELSVDPVTTVIATGTTLGIFSALFIILIGFIIYWKRLSRKESSDIQIQTMRRSVGVRTEDYEAYYRKKKADSNCGFAEEFEDLKVVGTDQWKTSALTLENKPKNRYNNVLPYDSSRVKLSIVHGSPHDDYINANYIPGYNSGKEFIAAQGPLPATVNEFWRMIWEKNVQTLVMLTRCNEQGRVKCEQYWEPGTKHFEYLTVTNTAETPLEDWTIREIIIKNLKTTETRSLSQFHFTAWPDHKVPDTTEVLISFRHLVREHMDQYSRHSPTVVHCSAGVGRTGTFIAIDRLIFQIERENIVDVFGIVHDMRMHRPLMVQTEDQYVYLNQCAMDIIRSRTGTNVDLIYQNVTALSIYENIDPKRGYPKNGNHKA